MASDERNDRASAMLEHAAWLRRLARGLVRDASTAEDLVQRTWTAALEHPPGPGAPVRAWLAAVLRNFVRQDRRAGERRTVREQGSARAETVAPGSEPLEKLELQRQLMDAVLALPEPYRTTIVHRYYDELAPREIARRANVPVKTVKTRLARALEKLREELDRGHANDRRAWLALAVPWIRGDGATWAVTAGGWIVNAKLKIGIATAVAAGTIAAVVHWSSPDPAPAAAPQTEPHVATVLDAGDAPEHVELAPTVVAERALAQPIDATNAKPAVAAPPAALETAARIHGRVADTTGNAIASIDVFGGSGSTTIVDRASGKPIARTDARGLFECDYPQEASRLEAENAAWTTVLAPALAPMRATSELLVLVAPRIAVHGRVVDEARQPVAGARVLVQFSDALRAGFGVVLDDAVALCPEATADAEGRFELPVMPACTGILLVQHPGFDMTSVPIPERSTFDVEIVLPKTPERHTIVRGIVVDAQENPIEGALVSHGAAIERTKADGRFEFDFAHAIGATELVENEAAPGGWKHAFEWLCAIKSGYRAVRVALPTSSEIRATEPFFTLVLAEPPLTIRGRVVDADGSAVAGADVWIADPTPFGNDVRREGEMWMTWKTSVEDALRADRHGRGTKADAEGRFALDGLLDREYALIAFDAATMRWTRLEHVDAGRDEVTIALTAQPVERVAGRVVSRRGKPIAGARVGAGRQFDPKEPPRFTASRITDAEGRFDFGELVTEDLHFQVTGQRVKIEIDILPPSDANLAALELQASLECHVQVDLGERKSFADAFAVLDAQGERTEMLSYRGASALAGDLFGITNGISDVVVVDESCVEVVLYKEAKEVKRMPLVLETTGVTTVRP